MLDTNSYLPVLIGFEVSVPYMYLDSTANVTVGVGNMLPDAASAQALAFVVNPDPAADPATPPTPATADQIAADFNNVSAQPKGYIWTHYRQFTQLSLPNDAIMALLNARLEGFVTDLITHFPDFNMYPNEACAAIVDMAYNLGVNGVVHGFPTFSNAVRNLDWNTAAAQCQRNGIPQSRNDWTKAQLLQAADDATAVAA